MEVKVKQCVFKIDPTFFTSNTCFDHTKRVCGFSETKRVKPVKSGSLATPVLVVTHRCVPYNRTTNDTSFCEETEQLYSLHTIQIQHTAITKAQAECVWEAWIEHVTSIITSIYYRWWKWYHLRYFHNHL